MITYSIDRVIGDLNFATFDKRIITMEKREDIEEYWKNMKNTLDIGTYQLTQWYGYMENIIWQKRIENKENKDE